MPGQVLLHDPTAQNRHVGFFISRQTAKLLVVICGQLETNEFHLDFGCWHVGCIRLLAGHESRSPSLGYAVHADDTKTATSPTTKFIEHTSIQSTANIPTFGLIALTQLSTMPLSGRAFRPARFPATEGDGVQADGRQNHEPKHQASPKGTPQAATPA